MLTAFDVNDIPLGCDIHPMQMLDVHSYDCLSQLGVVFFLLVLTSAWLAAKLIIFQSALVY